MLAAGFGSRKTRALQTEELLQLQFTTGNKTPFDGIDRVLPGETLVVSAGRIIERRRRTALPESGPDSLGEADALRRVEEALMDSVAVHLRSDVPYAMFLSGGIDSSSVLAAMARLNEHTVTAYTVGFPGTGAADERDEARQVAKSLGAEHVEISFDDTDFWQLLPAVAAAMDEPVADSVSYTHLTLPTKA